MGGGYYQQKEVKKRRNKMSKIKQVTYDFIVNSFVTIKAPIGTDPSSLLEQAHNKFVQQVTVYDIELTFETIYDPENEIYDEDWENYGNKKDNEK